jgi:hypothetical protein
MLGFDAVAADPVPGSRPDVGEDRPPARQGDGLEADPRPLLSGRPAKERAESAAAFATS